ncbi:MAG: hypothetical protein HY649_12530 [Acidobacteria bacterium]|nr:hypothetical protein [Acidobacteriota bacterium]
MSATTSTYIIHPGMDMGSLSTGSRTPDGLYLHHPQSPAPGPHQRLGQRLGQRKQRLTVIPGTVPNPVDFPSGCRFHPRCSFTQEDCKRTDMALEPVADHHLSACLLVQRKQISLARV